MFFRLPLKFVDLLLYGNFFIAFCAVAMLLQTELILFDECHWTSLSTFVFSATLCLYALHRIVGIRKVKKFNKKHRYHIIEQYKHHILIYGIISGIISFYLFFSLSTTNQVLIILPILLSLGYVLPFFGKERRLRDFDYVKIFLIAIVWGFMTVLLPIFERKNEIAPTELLVFVERMLFIFAITLPFDIRDLKVDAHIDVKTIPSLLGEKKSKWLAEGVLIITSCIAFSLWYHQVYSLAVLLGILFSYGLTLWLIALSSNTKHDYYFTALMDGTMILQFVLVLFFHIISD